MPGAMNIVVAQSTKDDTTKLAEQLEAAGYEVAPAFDGTQAHVKSGSIRPALVILDSNLLGRSGVDITRALRKDIRTFKLKILMLTDDTDPSVRAAALDAGVTDFVQKPISNDKLLVKIWDLIMG